MNGYRFLKVIGLNGTLWSHFVRVEGQNSQHYGEEYLQDRNIEIPARPQLKAPSKVLSRKRLIHQKCLFSAEQNHNNAHAIAAPPESDNGSIKSSQVRKQQLRGLLYISPTYPHFLSPFGEPEGLYCRAKRGIGKDQGKRGRRYVADARNFVSITSKFQIARTGS
jgi:hypothetical protein